MRDLYRALGLPGPQTNRQVIERALDQPSVAPELREAARFVLLDPARKARYDWALSQGQALAAARARLGLPEDPRLPGRARAFRPTPQGPVRAPALARRLVRTGWVAAFILGAATLVWVGSRANPKPQAPLPKAASASLEPQGEKAGASGDAPATRPPEDGAPISPPDHGWLQLGPEVRPLVPWQIDTDPGQDYALTLMDIKNQTQILTLYLRGGEPYRGLAPEGTFELAYATGTRWFGLQQGFGARAKVIKPALTYRVLAGAEGDGIWKLRLHPTSCEGLPKVPTAPAGSDAIPAPAAADPSL